MSFSAEAFPEGGTSQGKPFIPPAPEGWEFYERYPNSLSEHANPDMREAFYHEVRTLAIRYGWGQVTLGPGYNDSGQQSLDHQTIYLKQGAQPRPLIRQIMSRFFVVD